MKTVKFLDVVCFVEVTRYSNGRTAIQLVEAETGEPMATASTNLVSERLASDEIAIKDYSENEGMLEALTRAKIVSAPLRYIESGWVKIPICKLL